MPRRRKQKKKKSKILPILLILIVIIGIIAALYFNHIIGFKNNFFSNLKGSASQQNQNVTPINNTASNNSNTNTVTTSNTTNSNAVTNANTNNNTANNKTSNAASTNSSSKATVSNSTQNEYINKNSASQGNKITVDAANTILKTKVNKGNTNYTFTYDHTQIRQNQTYYVFMATGSTNDQGDTNGWYYVNVNSGAAYSWDLIKDVLTPIQ